MSNQMAVYICRTAVVASSKRVRLYTADAARHHEPNEALRRQICLILDQPSSRGGLVSVLHGKARNVDTAHTPI